MNIFITSDCPQTSAKNLDDKRVRKMVLESAQMLSTATLLNAPKSLVEVRKETIIKDEKPKEKLTYYFRGQKVYSPCYHNHPATKWARENKGNYSWLLLHFLHLCEEYEIIRGKKHASESLRDYLCEGYDFIKKGNQTEFVNCANNASIPNCDFRHVNPVPTAYQLYLNARFQKDKAPVTYTNRKTPDWVVLPPKIVT